MKIARILVLFVIVTAMIWSTTSCNKDEGSDLAKMYEFNLQTLDGKAIKLADYKGKVLILDMWDTWCPPCKMEIPHFIELQNEYGDKGFVMLGVAFGRQGKEAVQDFVANSGINYDNAMATQELMNGVGPINSIPTTFVIDQKGRIYRKYIGYKDKATFENDIRTLLKL